MKFLNLRIFRALIFYIFCSSLTCGNPPPLDFDEMWRGFDPRLDPLETEILKEWEEDGIVMKIIRYRIGKFKGQKSIMAGVYGYPKGQIGLPGLLQVHGGGQYAHSNAVLTNAKRGYATLSIAWAGRISAPGYTVSPNEVKLFWEGKKDDSKYKLTTDWGALDAYHAPSRYGRDAFASIPVTDWTIDPIKSPRNNSWFLITLAGRRGLTFLEQQPEVDGANLGVYGHSMGGKLTVLITGADKRVKAAVPSCGGISDRYTDDDLHFATVSDPPSLQRISVPISFLSPANDFHGRINDLEKATSEIKTDKWRISSSPHHNHQDSPEFEVFTQLWFDQHLRNNFVSPNTPITELILAKGKFPQLRIKPDIGRKILNLEVYFTQQGILQERGKAKDNSTNTKHRFWKFVQPTKMDGQNEWVAELPIFSVDRPLWVYANIRYPLDEPITGAGYYYGTYKADSFVLSSLLQTRTSEELKGAGSRSSSESSLILEDFAQNWHRDWFSYQRKNWGIHTNKLYEPKWAAPKNDARISLEVRSQNPNEMVIWMDGYGQELNLLGGDAWQRFSFSRNSFLNSAGESLSSWSGLRELRLVPSATLDVPRGNTVKAVKLGKDWQGEPPEFRKLCWIK
tara:strand:- start:2870 stop:4741 length:1872 start_codon:yes stop_codon:yes gene_type:complete